MVAIVDKILEDDGQVQEERGVLLRALGHTISNFLPSMIGMAHEFSITGVIPTLGPASVRNFDMMDRVISQLHRLGLDLDDVAVPATLEIIAERSNPLNDAERASITKLINITIAGYRHAGRVVEKDEQAVTALAEQMIATRAGITDYSLDDEAKDYTFAREFVYGLRAKAKPTPAPVRATFVEAEIDARLAALVA